MISTLRNCNLRFVQISWFSWCRSVEILSLKSSLKAIILLFSAVLFALTGIIKCMHTPGLSKSFSWGRGGGGTEKCFDYRKVFCVMLPLCLWGGEGAEKVGGGNFAIFFASYLNLFILKKSSSQHGNTPHTRKLWYVNLSNCFCFLSLLITVVWIISCSLRTLQLTSTLSASSCKFKKLSQTTTLCLLHS